MDSDPHAARASRTHRVRRVAAGAVTVVGLIGFAVCVGLNEAANGRGNYYALGAVFAVVAVLALPFAGRSRSSRASVPDGTGGRAGRHGRVAGPVTDPTMQHLAVEFLAGLVDHDFDRMHAALAPTATWSVPGSTAISGVAEGADAVVERARAVADGGVSIELRSLLSGWDRVAVLLHNTGRRGDTVLDEQVVIVLTMAEGRIVAAENLISDVAMLDAYFAAGA